MFFLTAQLYAQRDFDPTLPVQFCLIGGKVITSDGGSQKLAVTPPGTLKVINLGKNVNSTVFDYAPTVSTDGSMLYFVSNRAGSKTTPGKNNSHDIWAVQLLNAGSIGNTNAFNIDTSTKYGNRGLNTSMNEGVLSISSDQKTIYFTGCSREDGIGDCDIYSCSVDGDGNWGLPKNLGINMNSEDWESMPSISPDGKRLYFVSNRLSREMKRHNDSVNNIISLKLLNRLHEVLKNSLSEPDKQKVEGITDSIARQSTGTALGLTYDQAYQRLSHTLSWNVMEVVDNRIRFAIEDPKIFSLKQELIEDNHNIRNIWFSDYSASTDSWAPAQFLYGVNTNQQEVAPFICADGKTLLFSSNGYADTVGRLDFYATQMNNDNTWMQPVNLGSPLNTVGDDMFITMPSNSDVLYFSSTRNDIPDVQGSLDLYMAYVPLECALLKQGVSGTSETTGTSSSDHDNGALLRFNTSGSRVEAVVVLPDPGFISLKVYDIVGQEVATVVEQEFNSAGTYTFPLQLSELPSGAYFYRLEAGRRVITQGFAISR